IYLDGDANIVSRCTFMHCGQDGIDVNSGTGNVFDKCKAIDCVAEGFDNGGGTATILTNCTLKGSRIDYAGNNNVANDSGTSFGSGGKATPPEID
ncbi:MAG TPA: right-handed parallel beta-helix repeat-containing protein, partial [Pirellulaceae bacterium]|nr:right-handed parallel beta-helix repeat-containing protein [Pirellulaceae bacterium]